MRRLFAATFALLMLAGYTRAPRVASAQEAGAGGPEVAKTHVFMFDVSGSMNTRYGQDQASVKEWLVRPLLKNGAFGAGDKVIVRWFDQKGNTSFDPNETRWRRVKHSPYGEQLVLDNVPTVRDAGGNCTNIPEALDLMLADLAGYAVTGDVLIWIVTDNVQDACNRDAGKNITPFYNKIAERQGKEFHAAHLFPLGKEAGQPISGKPAMILYLLHYSKEPPRLTTSAVANVARETAKKIDNPAITWLPLERAIVPDPAFTTNEEVEIGPDGEVRLLTPVLEGEEAPTLNFTFKMKSRASQRTITGRIKNERFDLEWPSFIRPAAGESAETAAPEDGSGESSEVAETTEVSPAGDASAAGAKWEAQISPDEIKLEPEGKSKSTSEREYTVALRCPASLGPSSFWSALWDSTSPPIQGALRFDITDLQSEVRFDNPALDQVPNAGLIRDIVQKSVETSRPASITVEFQVKYDNSWRWLVVGLVSLVLLGLAIAAVLLLTLRTRYALVAAGGAERILALPVVGRQYVSVNGVNAAVISKRFGSLTIAPVGGHTIGGERVARPLTGNNDQFTIETPEDGRGYPHLFRRVARAAGVAAKKDTFLED